MNQKIEKVKCVNCGWQGVEDGLKQFDDAEGGGYGCPNCKTDHYLMDVPQEKPIQYYCDNCNRLISGYQYRKGQGLCKVCIDAIN